MGDIPIGFLIKDLRERAGLSQRQFGKRAGIDRGYISLLESGKTHSITITTAEKLAKGFDMSLGGFLDTITIEDEDIRAFLTNELPELSDDNKELLRHSINIIRERVKERDRYKSAPEERG